MASDVADGTGAADGAADGAVRGAADGAGGLLRWVPRAARALLAEEGVQPTLERAVQLVVEHVPAAAGVSVTLHDRRGRTRTPVSTAPWVERADALQYETGQGPCLRALREREVVHVPDLARDREHPDWAARVVAATPARSALAFQLFTDDDQLGALNLYATSTGAFDTGAVHRAHVLAAQVAVALSSAQREEQLREGMGTRTVIGQAQGILMERYGLDGQQAFRLLSRVSQDTNTRLHDVARELVSTGRTPGAQDGTELRRER
ncbi:GAF and ANTAR domain-containing protein [Kineococcus terrestris]|uniref:GAF and ANTAR domain-containing protein n=1 Tax=Kineococcus terrestris TaxID=2044856 RepID=UPI0034DABBED